MVSRGHQDLGLVALLIRGNLCNDPRMEAELKKESEYIHPCQKCGACCASFRVGFYWREGEPEDHANAVPAEYWQELTSVCRCMKGTDVKHQPKCAALKGRVGKFVSCSIYENRPSTCRAFEASYETGVHHEKCDIARAKHGLKPLSIKDWK